MKPALYLIPAALGGPPALVLPDATLAIVRSLQHFAVENARSARAFLVAAGMRQPLQALHIEPLDGDAGRLLAPMREGHGLGVISEAGCPGIADPGQALVAAAHRAGYRVVPLVGPSSLVLALMASGLEGQRFTFHGYLPRERAARAGRIRALERRSREAGETQIFIETPYRNEAMLDALLACCQDSTRVCVAANLTLPDEEVVTRSVADWRSGRRQVGRRPAVFLLLA